MKKTIKPIVALFVVLTLCLGLLAGCAGGGSPVGTWKVSGAEALGQSVDPSTLGDTANATITLNADGTITEFGKNAGTWKLDGNKLTLVENGITLNCEYNGSTFILDLGIAKMTYSRV